MCPLEADAPPSARTDENRQGLRYCDCVPCKIPPCLSLLIKAGDQAQTDHSPNRESGHVDEKRGDDFAVATNPKQYVPILDEKYYLADHHDYAELLKHHSILGRVAGIKLSAHHRECDHDA